MLVPIDEVANVMYVVKRFGYWRLVAAMPLSAESRALHWQLVGCMV